jgi:hypothetical protein
MRKLLQKRYARKGVLLGVLALCMATAGVAVSRGSASTAGTSPTLTFAKGEPTAPPPPPLNPCTLLTQTDVGSAMHATVANSVQVPLGPTCKYATAAGTPALTIAVEPRVRDLPIKRLTPMTIAGHSAYCGELGKRKDVLVLFLGKYTMLTITAPCLDAARLAPLALGRLPTPVAG